MAPRDGSQERTSTPDTVEKSIATINTLRYTKKTPYFPNAYRLSNFLSHIMVTTLVADGHVRIGVKAFVEKVSRIFLSIYRAFQNILLCCSAEY